MPSFRVRDVVDMDVALHGRRFIVIEFVLMVAFGFAFAGMELYLGGLRGHVVGYQLVTAAYVAFVTVNCATFLVLAVGACKPSAPDMRSVYWLTVAALVLLALPLAFPVAAARQAATVKRV